MNFNFFLILALVSALSMRFSPSGSASGAVATGRDPLEYRLKKFLAKRFLAKRSLAKSFLAKRQNFFGMDPEPPEDWEPTVHATAKTLLAKRNKRSLANRFLAKRSLANSFLAKRQNLLYGGPGQGIEPPEEDWVPNVATAKTFLAKRQKFFGIIGMDSEPPEDWKPTVRATAKTSLAKRQNLFDWAAWMRDTPKSKQ